MSDLVWSDYFNNDREAGTGVSGDRRHYFITPQDADNEVDSRFCFECGKYLTNEIHFRVGETE